MPPTHKEEATQRLLIHLDRSELISLVTEKDKRIEDLERLVEDQKRLRLQDSSQVEEKAAKIKEWVTKKLKELENQNKLLRDQNKKQKEVVDNLSNKLALLSPISSPRKQISINNDLVQYIDHSGLTSIVDTIDVNQSLRARRPQLKHKFQLQQQQQQQAHNSCSNVIISQERDNNQDKICITLDGPLPTPAQANGMPAAVQDSVSSGAVSRVSIGHSQSSPFRLRRQPLVREPGTESPLYDTVQLDPSILAGPPKPSSRDNKFAHDTNHYDQSCAEPSPPPLPLHQSDVWERQLYHLAEQTFLSLTEEIEAKCQAVSDSQQDSIDSELASNKQNYRKSSALFKESIKSFAKPLYTTIDGDQVVDDENSNENNNLDKQADDARVTSDQMRALEPDVQISHGSQSIEKNLSQNSASLDHSTTSRRRSDEASTSEQRSICQNLFSPMRSRSGKDSTLRTQSVKRNPAPEKLYDFISADLVKKSYLLKHGAIRCHQRWFVLKGFYLHSYKRESDETDKIDPSHSIKLDQRVQIQILGHTNDGHGLKISWHDKQSLTLFAETSQLRDEWVKMLTAAINMSDIEPAQLAKNNATYEGIMTITRQGHSKRCHAILVNHLVFFLKSPIDPTPLSYVSVKNSKIREFTDVLDYDPMASILDTNTQLKIDELQDCSLAIYPRYSQNLDPIYITLGNQQETDEWFHHLSIASGLDQASGTKFERSLTQLMISTTVSKAKNHLLLTGNVDNGDSASESGAACIWRYNSAMLYSDKPIAEPLTSLPNETLKSEAVKLFKSILLFTQVPIEPVAIDYHVCLLQNCLTTLLKYPELRNEFYAHLIKQSTFVKHRCCGSKLSSSSSSSGCSSINQRTSINSIMTSGCDCPLVTDLRMLESISSENKYETRSTISQCHTQRDRADGSPQPEEISPPSSCELSQVMQVISLAVSLNLPKGRLRWWLIHHLQKFSNPETSIGKYALFALKAINRNLENGARDNVPSRTEIMSILLRNPYDHSTPHSLPVHFDDGSSLVVGADGSTTVEEFMLSMGKFINIRPSHASDFYLFANDPLEVNATLHILEHQRKILDVVGWWEHTLKQHNSGRYQNTRAIKIYCRKRLILRSEEGETDQERLMIVQQFNNEMISEKVPITDALLLELGAIMTQLTFGDYLKSKDDAKMARRVIDRIESKFLPQSRGPKTKNELAGQVVDRWRSLSGRTAQSCVRVYLNCIRKLKL